MAQEPGAFERDFGYLFPFLDKLVAAARAMPAGAARTRLEQLLSEERARFEEIRALFSGKAPTVTAKATPAKPAPASATAAQSPQPPENGLTVGSLRRG